MFARMANWRLPFDLRTLLLAPQAEAVTEEAYADSFRRVYTIIVD